MDSQVKVTVTACPNCGAPVDPVHVDLADPKCRYCERPLPVEHTPETPTVVFTSGDLRIGRETASAPKLKHRGCLTTLFVIVMVALGPAIAVVANSASSRASADRLSLSQAIVPAGPPGQVYTESPIASGRGWRPTRLDVAARKVLWTSAPLTSGSSATALVAADDAVVAIDGTDVVGLDAATGRFRWRGSLAYELAGSCDPTCAAFSAGHVVALSKDGTVQSLDATTGHQAWSKRLNSSPRALSAVGALVAVDDTLPGAAYTHTLTLFNPASGATHSINGACPSDPEAPRQTNAQDAHDFFLDADGAAVTVVVSGTGGCASRFGLSDGAPVWTTPSTKESPIPFTWTGEAYLAAPGLVAWTKRIGDARGIFALDTKTGNIRMLLAEPKSAFGLAGVAKGVLIVQVKPDFDASHPAIWGIDMVTGKRIWQLPSRSRGSSDDQRVVVTAGTAIITSCQTVPSDRCTFEAVDPRSGTVTGSSTVKASIIPTVESVTAATGGPFLNIDNEQLIWLDPMTAAIKGHMGRAV